ncbi:hypothetical protein AC1031_011455 [Aphanomyces cochlioides]|nr:hypothetical protein AC1031_011455 [Aphanomyces cochlioides]
MVERLKIPIDTTKTTGINGLGSNAISTFGMVKIKLTIGNGLVFIFSLAVCDGHTQTLRDLQAQANQASAGGAGATAGSGPPVPSPLTQADLDIRLDARMKTLQDQMNERMEKQAEEFKTIDEMVAEAYALASAGNQDEAVVEASMRLLQGIFQQLAARTSTPATSQSDPSQRLCL